jgi:nitronate monooxygenase
MPGRAIRNDFIKDLESKGNLTVQCPYRCLTACKADRANYCIAKVLLNSCFGDVKNGLIFCGQNAHRIDKIVTVRELFDELVAELKAL